MEKVHYSRVMTDNDILIVSKLYTRFEKRVITFRQLRCELELLGYGIEKYISKNSNFKNNQYLTDENISASFIDGLLLTRGNMHHILYKKDYKALCVLAENGDFESMRYLDALKENSNITSKIKTLKK